jgi:hypothetical protein
MSILKMVSWVSCLLQRFRGELRNALDTDNGKMQRRDRLRFKGASRPGTIATQ